MTVKELIAALQTLDPNLPVQTEGCDCDGNVYQVTVEQCYTDKSLYAYLRRSEMY